MKTETDPLHDAVVNEFSAAGYADEEIRNILAQQDELRNDGAEDKEEKLDKHRKPTWIKVSSKHVSERTLEAYHLPWEYDEFDVDWIFIKKWISLELQEELFEHTRQLQGGGDARIVPTGKNAQFAEVKVNDRKKWHYGGRRGAPPGKKWIYT
ncbi:hypothetical protein BJY01DRAFT_219210 [Aspergillus pseudoustus]|uniref:Uncharacterized protein n=1 Tax=Aspergillus pseudoustus TaxID=1810923 RepID=A0ABR4JHH0_9EURO